MLRSMLVGLSGSVHSRAAAELAIAWARGEGASLVGIAVVDEAVVAPPESLPIGAGPFKRERDEAALAAARGRNAGLLAEFERRCGAAGVPCRLIECEGVTGEVLSRESQRTDLVLVGKKGAVGEGGPAITLALHDLLRQAARPVVCVPADPAPGEGVLVAYDGSLQAARTLLAWASLDPLSASEVRLFAVESRAGELDEAMERAREFVGARRPRVEVTVDQTGAAVAKGLLDAVRRHRPAMLVMGAYGRSRLVDFFLGSVTQRLLRETPVPLFLYH